MPPTHRWHSRGQEPPAPDRDQTGLVVLLSALSCRQATEGGGLRTVAGKLRRWRLPLRRGGADVFGGMWLIDGRQGTVPPTLLMPLRFDVAPLRVRVCFLGAIIDVKEAFS